MTATRRSYILIPDYDTPPNALALGDILLDPTKPHMVLNARCRIPIDLSKIRRTHEIGWEAEVVLAIGGRLGARTLSLRDLLGLSVIGDRNSDVTNFAFQQLDTEDFVPDNAYVEAAMRAPDVTNFLEGKVGMSGGPDIYMVTGVKVARGVTVKGTSVEGTRMVQVSLESSSDIVFAFRLSKVRYVVGGMNVEVAVLGVEDRNMGLDEPKILVLDDSVDLYYVSIE
jgi:hypothetical protein